MEALSPFELEVARLLVETLHLEDIQPEDIQPEEPLFGEGLGLDSIDALELVLAIEQTFGVKIEDEASGMKAFRNVEALAAFIAEKKPA